MRNVQYNATGTHHAFPESTTASVCSPDRRNPHDKGVAPIYGRPEHTDTLSSTAPAMFKTFFAKHLCVALALATLVFSPLPGLGVVTQPENPGELVYSLPVNILSQKAATDLPDSGEISPVEAAANLPHPEDSDDAQVKPESTATESPETEYLEAELFFDTEHGRAAPAYPARAVAAYGNSAAMEQRPSVALHVTKGQSEAIGMVTDINRQLSAPLGMRQLAAGNPDNAPHTPAGESRFSAYIDLGEAVVRPSLGVYWHGDRHTEYYFGMIHAEPGQTEFKERETAQGYSPFLGLTVDVPLGDNVSAFVNGEVSFPGDSLKGHSALRSSSSQSVTTGIVYTFN